MWTNKWLWIGLGSYVAIGIFLGYEFSLHDIDYPILRGMFWPVPVIRWIFGATL